MRVKVHRLIGAWVALLLLVAGPVAAADLRLVEAAKQQDRAAVRKLVAEKIDVNATQPDGATALHWAVQWDDLETAALLLRAGADAKAANVNAVTPLALAALNGSGAMVSQLLAAGANPNTVSPITGESVLMTAARSGSVEAVRALVRHGADVHAKDPVFGQNALMWAAMEGHADVVRELVEQGANVRTGSTAGFTPLLFAARTGNIPLVEYLLGKGADVNEAATNGTTALVIATIRSHTTLARFLLDRGADPNRGPGFTVLHWAAGDWAGGNQANEAALPPSEDSERSALQGLRGSVKVDFIKLLLASGADINARAQGSPRANGAARGGPGEGATPLWFAAKAADASTIRLLVENGADPLIATKKQTTPLMAAVGVGGYGPTRIPEPAALEAATLLVALGADVNAVNEIGETALHGAASRSVTGATTLTQLLVDKGAKLNIKNRLGWTPLAIAEGIYFGVFDTRGDATAELLRKLGAEPSGPDVQRDGDIAYAKAGLPLFQ